MAKVFVLGSLNLDTTYYVNALPNEGETVTSLSSESAVGGKGLNQAAAVAWTGVDTGIIGAIGDDESGRQMRAALERQKIDLSYLKTSRLPTGSAAITGRLAYACKWNGRACLLVRSFPNEPSGFYEEEPPLQPGGRGFSVHVYNDGGPNHAH